jgi:hypothetical protein
VTILGGQSSTTVIVNPIDDALIEGPETVVLTLAADPAYTIGAQNTATVIIADNDSPVVTITATDANAAEAGLDPGTFSINRVGPTANALTVFYAISGTATNGTDYQVIAASVTIPAGAASTTLTITPIDDGLFEGPETVVLTLSANPAYSIGAPGAATVTIADDELPVVTIAATDDAASEAGPASGTFTITRTGPTTNPLTVNYAIAGSATNGTDYQTIGTSVTILAGSASATVTDPGVFTFTRSGGNLAAALTVIFSLGGTAANNADYAFTGGSVSIPANQTSATVTITPIDDVAVEGDETVVLTIQPSSAYIIGAPGTATVTIADND